MALPADAGPSDLQHLKRGWLAVLGGGFAPGALTGTHLAGLIFFLNPGLPFSFVPVLRGVLLYAGLLGLVSLVLHLPFTWGRPTRASRVLPWSLTVALAASGLLDWSHASYFSYYLPPGINERLIATALWLSLGALISFYTALLHSLHHRRYGLRSRSAYVLLAALSVYAMVERREAFRLRPSPTPRPAAVEASRRPELWVIGIDSATLDAILPLAGQGRLPFLASVLQGGAYGRLTSLSPTRRDTVWTTLATGKYPFKHGIAGRRPYAAGFLAPGAELRLLPIGISFRRWGTMGGGPLPPGTAAREALALWEILPRLGVPSGVVGWPEAAPTSGEAVFGLSDHFFGRQRGERDAWPADLAERARLFQPGPGEIDPVLRSRFGPRLPEWLLEALAGDLWRHSLTLALADQNPQAGAVFLLLPGLRDVSRRTFGGFSAVKFEGAQGASTARIAAERLAAYYGQLDARLAEVWTRRDGPRLLAVVSAYGVDAQGGWRRIWGRVAPGKALGGEFLDAPDGAILLYGAGIRPGALLTGARLVDVAPTLLYGLGFPVARDLDGRVLTDAFDKGFLAENPVTFFPSYEGLAKAEQPSR
ncbi:MAG TPA: alkaline phosphatase family protein [Thermoanaerobaculia bacterium]|nr:alkaline phosphatase family protein [Thermoanaerobaculia bacterium]